MQNSNVKLMSGKIVEELSEAQLDERIKEVKEAIVIYKEHLSEKEANLLILQGVKDSI